LSSFYIIGIQHYCHHHKEYLLSYYQHHQHINQPKYLSKSISYLFAVSGAFFPSRLTSVRGVVEETPSTTALGDVNPDDDFLRSFKALDGLDRVVLLVLLMTLLLSSSLLLLLLLLLLLALGGVVL